MRSEFTPLAGREPRIDRELTRFLATAYQFKAATDYGVGPAVMPISADEAAAAIATAGRFITPLPNCCPQLGRHQAAQTRSRGLSASVA